jgi:hypothetical protein
MTPSFFTSSFYLSHYRLFLSSSFENSKCDLPQLKCPKVVKANNTTWCPKVAEVNSNIWHPKVAKSNNVTMNVFYTFHFSSILFIINLAKHNDQQVFHLDFISTLKIGKSQLHILLMRQGHVQIFKLSMLLLPFHLSFVSILMSTHLIGNNR